MRPHVLALLAAILLGAGTASAQPATASRASPQPGAPSTQTFVRKAAISDMYEIQAANIALKKSQNAQVKDFAQKMVTDHTQTSQQMMAALPSGVTAPTMLDKAHQAQIDALNKASASQFDSVYAMQQVKAHKAAVSLMKAYAAHGSDAKLKMLASMALPLIQMHLQMAQMLPGAPK